MRWIKNLFSRDKEDAETLKWLGSVLSEPYSPPDSGLGTIELQFSLDEEKDKEKGVDYLKCSTELLKNEIFGQEIREYIAEQMTNLALTVEGKEAHLIRGKMQGVTELYHRIKGYELQVKEGVETKLDTIGADLFEDELA